MRYLVCQMVPTPKLDFNDMPLLEVEYLNRVNTKVGETPHFFILTFLGPPNIAVSNEYLTNTTAIT